MLQVSLIAVATVLTACGIETLELKQGDDYVWSCNSAYRLRYWNTTSFAPANVLIAVATVLTACGIETMMVLLTACHTYRCNSAYRLRYWNIWRRFRTQRFQFMLQQCLPLAVLKQHDIKEGEISNTKCCNSAYRLRYWNFHLLPCPVGSPVVATVLTACGIETIKKEESLTWDSL